MDAIAKEIPGWSRTNFSTGLPQRINRGICKSFIRASVTATTGVFGGTVSSLDFGISNSSICPHFLRYFKRVCHPFASVFPNVLVSKKLSIAVSFFHCAKTAICRIRIRLREKIGPPKVIYIMHSAWTNPGVFLAFGGANRVFSAVLVLVSTRWKVNTLILFTLLPCNFLPIRNNLKFGVGRL